MKRPELSFDYKKIGKKTGAFVSKYRVILTAAVILGVFSFAILRVRTLADPVSNQERFIEQAQGLERVNFNQDAIDTLNDLEKSDVQIKPILPSNRNNPFSE